MRVPAYILIFRSKPPHELTRNNLRVHVLCELLPFAENLVVVEPIFEVRLNWSRGKSAPEKFEVERMSWRERYNRAGWPYPSPKFSAEELRSKITALLLIDMQNYLHYNYGVGKIIRDRYPDIARYYLPRLKDVVIPNVSRLLDFFRKKGHRVVYTTIGPELPDGSDMVARRRKRDGDAAKALGAPHLFPKGTTEHQIMQEVKPTAGELVINKNCSSPFNCTGIDQILRNMGIENLVIAGISTDACVITTARDAADRGYSCVVVEDACASFDEFAHEAALLNFARTFGVVMTCDELLSTLGDRT